MRISNWHKALLVTVVMISSCVPNKKIVYLQKDDVKLQHEDILMDTVLRTYPLDTFQYRLQTNDVINIRFQSITQDEYDFLNQVTSRAGGGAIGANAGLIGELIDDEGMVSFPVIGNVKVAGLTIFEAQEKLQSIAAQYLESPTVDVRLLNFRFTILGEVIREGTVTSFNYNVTMMEALGLAGGLSEIADRTKVKVIRRKGSTSEVFYVNLLEEDYLASNKYFIHQNDVIVVPPLRQRPFRVYYRENLGVILSSITALLLVVGLVINNN